jgi:hypothetical protein
MKPLWIKSVSGLYQELYQPDTKGMISPAQFIDHGVLDAGLAFWRSLFVPERIRRLIDTLEDNMHGEEYEVPQFLAILADKKRFISRCIDHSTSVCDNGLSDREFFEKLETLSILCLLYSRFEFHPFELSLQSGFLLNEVSSTEIIQHCLNYRRNPYLAFAQEIVIPKIVEYSPSIIFLCGRIGYFSTSIALMLKKKLPDLHICATRHASEYYSLNKILKYLRKNDKLFQVFDSVILEDFDRTEREMIARSQCAKAVTDVTHVITSANYETYAPSPHLEPPNASSYLVLARKPQVEHLTVPPDQTYDVHFDPHVKCYWNECVFCGINKKYHHDDLLCSADAIRDKSLALCAEMPNGASLWFIDEAIHPSRLSIIADSLISSHKHFIWQARCRIDSGLLQDGLPEKLAKSGLKELRLGLESGSLRVLHLMKKFDEKFDLNVVLEIVAAYSDVGISIHFPMIIGFPGETSRDRQLTYEFLSEICGRYEGVTFNINIFNFDVASPLFKLWDQYQISMVTFPCSPREFIGNIVGWDDPMKTLDSTLERERNAFMRSRMFEWMPTQSIVNPILFYRLSETIRNTLTWKTSAKPPDKTEISMTATIKTSSDIVVMKSSDGDYVAYNWKTHHYMKGNTALNDILTEWRRAKKVCDGVNNIIHKHGWFKNETDALSYINKLTMHGHFVPG